MQLGKRRAQLETLFLYADDYRVFHVIPNLSVCRARTREIKVLSDLSPVGLFRVNTDGDFIYANQRWRDITGVPLTDEASFTSMYALPIAS